MRRLNYKLFLCLCGALVVLIGLVFAVHWFQTGSISRALLARADRAEKDNKPEQVDRYISRYLELQPDDNEQRARLGRILASESQATTPKARARAALVLENVLRIEPDKHDLRLKLVALDLDLDRLPAAEEHLDYLQKAQKDNGEVEYLRGRLAEAKRDPGEAIRWYARATTHAPKLVESYVRRADLLRQKRDDKSAKEADAVMAELVVANGQDAKALLARWQYNKRNLGLEAAANGTASGDVTAALKASPESGEALLAAAELEQVRKDGKAEAAREYLEKGRKLFPHDARMYRELALLELREGTRTAEADPAARAKALAYLREGCKTVTGSGQSDLLWTLGNVLLDGINGKVTDDEVNEARRVIAQIAKANGAPASVDYLNARVFMQQGNWSEAARLLAITRPALNSSPELAKQADLFLAQCRGQLNDPEATEQLYRKTLAENANSLSARLGLAAILASQGKIAEAYVEYSNATRLPDAPASCWVECARLLALQEAIQSTRGGAKRSPEVEKRIDDAIKEAEAKNADAKVLAADRTKNAVALTLLRAEVLVERGDPAAADQLLRKAAETDLPGQVELWAARAMLTVVPDGIKDPNAGKQILDDAEKALSDRPELRIPLQLARVRFWVLSGGPQAVEALKKIEETTKGSVEERAGLLGELAEAHYRLSNPDDAARLWDILASLPQNKNNLALRLLLFDLALQADNDKLMESRIAEVRRVEGSEGAMWRYATAARLIAQARHGKKDGLDEALGLLNKVAQVRKNWGTVDVALGNLYELKGNPSQAILAYQNALRNQERSPRVVRQLVELLTKQQRPRQEIESAMSYLNRSALSADESQQFDRLMVNSLLRAQDLDAVRKKMSQLVLNSNDYRDYLWQGQVLAASGDKNKEAEQKLRKAIELSGNAPDAWVALVQFLARTDRKRAGDATRDAEAKMKGDKELALGQCYEALGQNEEARKRYESALAAKPNDAAVLRGTAGFFIRSNQLKPAEECLRTLMATPSTADAAWARRILATAVASRAEYRRYPEALALVGLKLDETGRVIVVSTPKSEDPVEERRTQALVLAAQPLPEPRRKAIEILEELRKDRTLAPDDHFLLGQLYEADGKWDKARATFIALPILSRDPLFLSQYILALLRRGEWQEAGEKIARLEKLEQERGVAAGDFGSAELKAQHLEATRKGTEAIDVLTKYVDASGTKPEKVFVLIGCLARQQKYSEALDRCVKARATCKPELVGGATVAVLRAAGTEKARVAEAEDWLKKECEREAKENGTKNPRLALLYLHRADLRDMQNDLVGAEQLCRQAREQDGMNLVTLNNLAWLLAQNGKAGEALTVINEAIEVAGPRAELLDTRATVYLAQNRGDLALADIEAANADSPTAMRYFHMAQAQRQANNNKEAASLLQKATKSGLKKEQMHPVERAAYDKLVNELQTR